MNSEIKKVVAKVKNAQERINTVLKNQDWVEEARKYAEKQRVEVKKLLSSDLGKVKTFIERERKELERFQKEIPGEVKKFKTLLKGQRKELEKLLSTLRKAGVKASRKKAAKSGKKAKGKASSKKKSGASTAATTA